MQGCCAHSLVMRFHCLALHILAHVVAAGVGMPTVLRRAEWPSAHAHSPARAVSSVLFRGLGMAVRHGERDCEQKMHRS